MKKKKAQPKKKETLNTQNRKALWQLQKDIEIALMKYSNLTGIHIEAIHVEYLPVPKQSRSSSIKVTAYIGSLQI